MDIYATTIRIANRGPLGLLPATYYGGLLDVLEGSGRVRFHTFQDLKFDEKIDISTPAGLKAYNASEMTSWNKYAKTASKSCHVVVLHDSDSGPGETIAMLEQERAHGAVSTTSVFARFHRDGVLVDYPIDFDALRAAQDEAGACITYHCNAWENCRYQEANLAATFKEDLRLLRSHGLRIRFFSPHGGKASPDGRNNHSFHYPALVGERLGWTHNSYSISGVRYSDGGLVEQIKKNSEKADLRAYILSQIRLRERLIMLLHPQYYFAESGERARPYFDSTPWLKEFWNCAEAGNAQRYWAPVAEALEKLPR